jgi:hypothetical protein
MIKTETASFTCVRDCFYLNKYFKEGEAFPENWINNGFKPGKHFAPRAEAGEIIRTGRLKTHVTCHGDDPRSNVELRKILADNGIEDAENWTRKELWEAVRNLENAAAKTQTNRKEK